MQTLLGEKLLKNSQGQYDDSGMLKELSVSADWTVAGAHELLKLANNYGAFMLPNALAIAVLLGKEDGSERF
jgi:hypothetical protein